MEISDLKYFIVIANRQSIQQAARELPLSPSALSKSIARLEDELGRPLFLRVRQRLQLTEAGSRLREHASLIVNLQESALLDIKGTPATIHARICGPEACLLYAAPRLRKELSKLGHPVEFHFLPMGEEEALQAVKAGGAHLAVVCTPARPGLTAKLLTSLEFKTYAGQSHPLIQKSGQRSVQINEVLRHPFAVCEQPFFGSVTRGVENFDGWRDDKFLRKISFRTASLKLLEELVVSGEALAYLPEYYGNTPGLRLVKITGCPYTCRQQLRLVAFRPELTAWINRFF